MDCPCRCVVTQHARGIGIILRSLEGDHLEYAACLHFQVTNNETEYEALITGLNLVKALGVDLITI